MGKIYNKCKDRTPIQTISIVKDFMLGHGILPVEKWFENASGLYSVSLSVENHSFHVNGKGTSRAFALASAYGEFMERFQNMVFIRMHSRILDTMTDIGIDLENSEENQEACIRSLQQKIALKIQTELPVASLKKYLSLKNEKILKCCEFENILDHEKFLIPYGLLDYYYGTNGMVAGNTISEAFVEGLSEILERHVIKQFIEHEYTPPYLDDDILKQLDNYQAIMAYIKAIERSGSYRVELRDLSMGIGIPAVGLILYQISKPAYFVKAGVHPILEIAVERCFTELMQGQTLDKYVSMVSLTETEIELQKEINIHNFYANGHGAFPLAFFEKMGTFTPIKTKQSFESNEQMKEYLISLISGMGYQIFVHNCTYTEIASYQFIVPGMSEGISLAEVTLKNLIEDVEISDLLKMGLCNFNKQQAKQLKEYLDICGFDKGLPVGKLIMDLKFKGSSIFMRTPLYVLEFNLAMFLKDYNDALICVQQINKYLSQKNLNNSFYRCYEDYLSLMPTNSIEKVRNFLKRFYQGNLVDQVIDASKHNIFQAFYGINCSFECKKCAYSNDCLTKNDKAIYISFCQNMKQKDNSKNKSLAGVSENSG